MLVSQSQSSNGPRRWQSIAGNDDSQASAAMYGHAELATTCCYFLLASARATIADVTLDFPIVVFIPLQCPRGQVYGYNATVTKAIETANADAEEDGIVFTAHVYDSCSEEQSFVHLFQLMNNWNESSSPVVVGPGNNALCDISAKLLSYHNETLITWDCINRELSDREVYRTLMRTSASVETAMHAMCLALRHFKYHYVTVIYGRHLPESVIANQLHMQLTEDGFEITAYHRLGTDYFEAPLEAKLRSIDPLTKGKYT